MVGSVCSFLTLSSLQTLLGDKPTEASDPTVLSFDGVLACCVSVQRLLNSLLFTSSTWANHTKHIPIIYIPKFLLPIYISIHLSVCMSLLFG